MKNKHTTLLSILASSQLACDVLTRNSEAKLPAVASFGVL